MKNNFIVRELSELSSSIVYSVPKLGWAIMGVKDGFQASPKMPPGKDTYQEIYDSGYDLGKKCR